MELSEAKRSTLGELRGIVDEEANLLHIFLRKKLLGHLKGFIHTLTDGNTGYYDNELAPAVVLFSSYMVFM